MTEPPSTTPSPSAASERPEFRRARLAVLFLQASYPLTTAEIAAQVYNNPADLELGRKPLSADSARKALKRDIDALKATGLIIDAAGKTEDGQNLWEANRELSFTQGVALSEEDAAILDIACLPLLDDPGFPERDELRLALTKIDRLFDAAATDALTASAARDSDVLVAVREALNARRALDISYTARNGSTTTRRVAPLAFFDIRSTLYVVCSLIDENGTLAAGSERTYRLDRISRAQRLDHIAFEIPGDFDADSFRKLPFQIGPASIACSFSIPIELCGALSVASYGKGTFTRTGTGTIWEIEAADLDAAAAWAIAYGIRPLAPEALVAAWRARLQEAMRHG